MEDGIIQEETKRRRITSTSNQEAVLRKEIYRRIAEIFKLRKKRYRFVPVESKVQYSGTVYDEEEVIAMVDAILDGWFVVGKRCREFEKRLARFLATKDAIITNSGSSANLLAVNALMSSQLDEERLKQGDEVITPAVTFPTTFSPIVQSNLVPVLMDIELGTYNVNPDRLGEGLSEKTRAIMIPHTLGNPNQMDAIMDFAEDYQLYVIEDSCDALGAKYDGKFTGTFGIMGTFSFYPAHHITMGEGGAIVSDDDVLPMILRSLRDWGRACVCPVCQVSLNPDYNCPLRFQGKAVDMPEDYDLRYVYVNIGYNLKPIEMQAAMGLAQLRKLREFIKARKRNFRRLYEEFERYEKYFILPVTLPKSEPSWYSFPLTIRKESPFKRKEIINWLNKHNIEVKNVFAGNISRQPAYKNVEYRISQSLHNSDVVMNNSFFIGLYPGIDDEKMNFMVSTIRKFMNRYT